MNPVGQHEKGLLADRPRGKSSNLFPIIGEVMRGERPYLEVFGADYDTKDGSAVRDFVHVMDVAEAHVHMLNHMFEKRNTLKTFDIFNIGTGVGHSVFDVIFAMEKVHGVGCVPYRIKPRRKGDVATSVVDVNKAFQLLGWKSKRSLLDMCKSKNLFRGKKLIASQNN